MTAAATKNDAFTVARAVTDDMLRRIGNGRGRHRQIAAAAGLKESALSRTLSLRSGRNVTTIPQLKTLCSVADALGLRLVIKLEPWEDKL